MKIIANKGGENDFAGRYPVCTVKGSEFAKVAEWLWDEYGDGYKYGMVIDVYNGYPVPEKTSEFEVDVLYLDDLFEEVVMYMGIKEAQERLDIMKGGMEK